MNRLAERGARCSLSSIILEHKYPVLPPEYLFILELEQDEYFPFLAADEVPLLIRQAMQKGHTAAKQWGCEKSFSGMINLLLKEGLTVRFKEVHGEIPSIRAEYDRKQHRISIYRSSVSQIRQLFQDMNLSVPDKDLYLLHLVHEWFHHLEETKVGRTDYALPRATVKQKGPFALRKPLKRLREIAAHTFTQNALNLAWSPLLLDYLLLYRGKGWSMGQIRKTFKKDKERIRSMYDVEQTDNDSDD
ncbi:hypothetical protein [Thermoactinomyces mirandus]|uniref:Uncharacterized protein n=1 Tax=Thermoactinomyces mirandus TaxID=2756294 RepID=A0A7W1XR17_9BACL|nr:hypothetical protein [Thermoactinomyces mirandus]MBA4601708.1 hypothetical protein [Thermoactinomyces mirandus]